MIQNHTSLVDISVTEFGLFICLADPGRLRLDDAAEWMPAPVKLKLRSSVACRLLDDILCSKSKTANHKSLNDEIS